MARVNTNPDAVRARLANDRIVRDVSRRSAAVGGPRLSQLSCCNALGYRDRGRRLDLDGRAHRCAQERTRMDPTVAIVLANTRLAETAERMRELRDWPGADDAIRLAAADAGALLDEAGQVMARLPDLIAARRAALR